MRSVRLLIIVLSFVVVGTAISLADLKEWKKLQFQVVGDVPVVQSLDQLRSVFTDPLTCSGCHPSQVEAWSRSYHAKSIQNAGFQTLYLRYLDYLKKEETKKELGREPTVEDLRQCLFCHAPQVQFASEKLVQQISDAIVAGQWDNIRGVQISCVVCHSVTPEGKWSSAAFRLDGTRYGPLRDPVPQSRSGHKAQYSDLHTKSELCALCHSQPPFNVFCSLVYDQYKPTAAAKQGQQCQDCHMKAQANVQVAVGGKTKRMLHSHLFPGGRFKEMWAEAIDLNLLAEQKGSHEALVTVNLKSKVPHNIPDG